ncbi:hypothetical protein ACIBG7_23015 [Nonomuraea sp. NPDC050328]|uniref:hypothetical protein n=1 Tax=Nonomuraea sp. NPDC050328 TaxID=3364361 RepID=UPI003799A4E2
MTAWIPIRDRIIARDPHGVAGLVLALSPEGRTEVARHLPALRDELNEADPDAWGDEDNEGGDGIGGHGAALRVAGAGALPGPAAVAAWLTRREFVAHWSEEMAPVIRVLTARPAAWQADLATRLTRKIRRADDRNAAPLALALLRACGAPPPEHDPLVAAWLRTRPSLDDPLFAPLLPRIFEAEGAGRALRSDRVAGPWLALLPRASANGRVSRAALLDGCLGRFLRGGAETDLRFFIRLHQALAVRVHSTYGKPYSDQ